MTYTPAISFAPGLYPTQPITTNSINQLIDNANMIDKPALVFFTNTAPTAITQATSGAFTAIGAAISDAGGTPPSDKNRPFVVQFTATLLASAAVANKAVFAWFNNGVQVGGFSTYHAKFTADNLSPKNITIMKYITGFTNTFDLRWTVEAPSPNVTFTMPVGFRILAWPI